MARVRAVQERLRGIARGRPLRPRRGRRLIALLGLLGPGLIAANAGNDAGGVATYSQVGARYGYDLLWMMVLITVSLAVVQRLSARMGAVTGKGLSELIREQYGIRWSLFATSAAVVANVGICVSDFAGIGAAFGLAGVPRAVSIPVAALAIWLILVRGSYRVAERIFIAFTLPFLAYPVAALLGHPHWGDVARGVVAPHVHLTSDYVILFIATAGTTITPYMQLYLQSAIAERGGGVEVMEKEQREAVAGAIFADLIAAAVIIATAATLYRHGIHTIDSATQAATALTPFAGRYAELLFAVGLIGAGMLAAAILPVATSYVVAESLGFEKGLSFRPSEAPVFTVLMSAVIAISAVVALIPGIPLFSLLIGVQVVNGVLLPLNLVFIWRLSRNPEIMGEYRSRGASDVVTAATVALTSALSLLLVGLTVTGH